MSFEAIVDYGQCTNDDGKRTMDIRWSTGHTTESLKYLHLSFPFSSPSCPASCNAPSKMNAIVHKTHKTGLKTHYFEQKIQKLRKSLYKTQCHIEASVLTRVHTLLSEIAPNNATTYSTEMHRYSIPEPI